MTGWESMVKEVTVFYPSLKYAEINFDSICNQYNNEYPAIISADFTDGSNVMVYLNKDGDIHSVIKSPRGRILDSRSNASKIDFAFYKYFTSSRSCST